MTAITITRFGGIAPKIPARYLSGEQAQYALNAAVWNGSLSPLASTSVVCAVPKSGDINSIYRFGQDYSGDDNYWFSWGEDVDVVRGFVFGDVTERTYFTGDGAPKVTNNALTLTGGTEYPVNYYDLGVPKPTVAPSCEVGGTADVGATDEETRVYTYTYVNSWGEESAPYSANPYPSTATATLLPGQMVNVTLPTTVSGNVNITHKRIYRSTAGTGTVEFLYVGQVTLATEVFEDTLTAEELNEPLPTQYWEVPPAGLTGLVGLPNGLLAGFVGQDVYFCEPYHPYAWPVSYSYPVGYPIVGLGVVDTTLVVLTKGKPFFIQGTHPENMAVVEADLSQACVSKRSIVSMDGFVFYASPDGLIALSPAGSTNITEQIMTKAQWQSGKPSKHVAFGYEHRYIAFNPDGDAFGFIYDTIAKQFIPHNISVKGGYSDLRNDKLFLISGSSIVEWEAGTPTTYQWRSKKFTFSEPTGFSCMRVRAESYPIVAEVFKDNVSFHTVSIASDTVYRLPPGKGYSWELLLTGDGEVYQAQIAQSPQELSVE